MQRQRRGRARSCAGSFVADTTSGTGSPGVVDADAVSVSVSAPSSVPVNDAGENDALTPVGSADVVGVIVPVDPLLRTTDSATVADSPGRSCASVLSVLMTYAGSADGSAVYDRSSSSTDCTAPVATIFTNVKDFPTGALRPKPVSAPGPSRTTGEDTTAAPVASYADAVKVVPAFGLGGVADWLPKPTKPDTDRHATVHRNRIPPVPNSPAVQLLLADSSARVPEWA